MYIVREKETGKIVTVNPIPVDSKLNGEDIYAGFNPKTMEIGWTDETGVPEHFKIGQDGRIVELSLRQKVEQGVIVLGPDEKLENDRIVEIEKTREDLVREGVVELSPHEKIEAGRIVQKTLEEQYEEGLLELELHEKIENDRIVHKTMKEQFEAGLISLKEPFEYIDEERVKRRPVKEVVENGLLKTLDQCEEALRMLDEEVEERTAAKYRPGYELKLTKRYLEWLNENKPKNDRREQKFLEMQTWIGNIKKEFKPPRAKVKQIIKELSP